MLLRDYEMMHVKHLSQYTNYLHCYKMKSKLLSMVLYDLFTAYLFSLISHSSHVSCFSAFVHIVSSAFRA